MENKRRLIVVEGMDGTGKTTLVNQLADRFKLIPKKFVKSSGPDSDSYGELVKDTISTISLMEILVSRGYPINRIYDRFPLISEQIYGTVLRGRNFFGGLYYPLWDRFLRLRPTIIYCRPNRGIIYENLQKNPQMEGVIEAKSKLLEAYDNFFYNLMETPRQAHVIVYDYSSATLDELIPWIEEGE